MAKGLRSKHRRRMRAIKRERYGKKELDRLKKTLGIVDTTVKTDIEIEESNVITFVHPEDLRKQKAAQQKAADDTVPVAAEELLEEDMEVIGEAIELRKKSGSYPVWMNQRMIQKISKTRAKSMKLKAVKARKKSKK